MRSQAQRRQYGEPVVQLPLSIRYRKRRTHGLESELLSISCSPLHISSPWAHVPLGSSPVSRSCPKWNGQPIMPLQRLWSPQRYRHRIVASAWRRPRPLNGKALCRRERSVAQHGSSHGCRITPSTLSKAATPQSCVFSAPPTLTRRRGLAFAQEINDNPFRLRLSERLWNAIESSSPTATLTHFWSSRLPGYLDYRVEPYLGTKTALIQVQSGRKQ
jgi:hypothetical protein